MSALGYAQQALANASVNNNIYNASNSTYYLTYYQTNMNMSGGTNGYSLAPNTETTYSGSDAGHQEAIMINGMDGVSVAYATGGWNPSPSSPGTANLQVSASCNFLSENPSYSWAIVMPSATNSANNERPTTCESITAFNGGWHGFGQQNQKGAEDPYSLLCYRNANANRTAPSPGIIPDCENPSVNIDILIPPDFPAPRSMPS